MLVGAVIAQTATANKRRMADNGRKRFGKKHRMERKILVRILCFSFCVASFGARLVRIEAPRKFLSISGKIDRSAERGENEPVAESSQWPRGGGTLRHLGAIGRLFPVAENPSAKN